MMDNNNCQDTIVAPATIPGTGAISIVRLSGPKAVEYADSIVNIDLRCAEGYSAHHAFIYEDSSEDTLLDEVIVTVFRAPRSFTGEDCVEISCHASSYIVSQIIFKLIAAGARSAEAGEFTQRAFMAGKMDLAQAEAVADLIASQNREAHKIAMTQMRGGVSLKLKEIRTKLLEITSLMELELDFSDEEVEFADRGKLVGLIEDSLEHIKVLCRSFHLGNAIKKGVPVAIVGAVNTGKSTLLNAILGDDRAIVSDVPGTTRDTVEDTVIIGGLLYRFIDTAGIRATAEVIEKIGIEKTYEKIESADIVICVLDSTLSPEVILKNLNDIVSKVNSRNQQLVILLNKVDIIGVNKNVSISNQIISYIDNEGFNPYLLEVSAKTGLGLEKLKETLELIQRNRASSYSSVMISNARHYEALEKTSSSLSNALDAIRSGVPTDLVSQDLREALHHLGEITGEICTDEILGEIFSKFCIGK